MFADIDPVAAPTSTRRTRPRRRAHKSGPLRPARAAQGARRAGRPDRRGRGAAACGARGIATTGVASTFSFFRPNLFGPLGDGASSASLTPSWRPRFRMLRFHGSHDKDDEDELTAGRDAGGAWLLVAADGWSATTARPPPGAEALGLGGALARFHQRGWARVPHVRGALARPPDRSRTNRGLRAPRTTSRRCGPLRLLGGQVGTERAAGPRCGPGSRGDPEHGAREQSVTRWRWVPRE